MIKIRKYKDTLHGFIAESNGKNSAWMLIRNKCYELGLNVPTIDMIINIESTIESNITKYEIMDKIEEIQDICYNRNIGINESDLDIRETLSDWILELINNRYDNK